MRPIPKELLESILNDSYYKSCARLSIHCRGKITLEHAIIYAGKQLNEKWAIIPLCEYHHSICQFQDSGDLNKQINEQIALNHATDKELEKISKAINYFKRKKFLNQKYGKRKNRKSI